MQNARLRPEDFPYASQQVLDAFNSTRTEADVRAVRRIKAAIAEGVASGKVAVLRP